MAVQINEVIVRAIITGEDSTMQKETVSTGMQAPVATITKNELLELIDEVINDKKER